MKEGLLQSFGTWHAPVRELIEGTREASIVKEEAWAQTAFPRGEGREGRRAGRRRVTLVGDAAHGVSQGGGGGREGGRKGGRKGEGKGGRECNRAKGIIRVGRKCSYSSLPPSPPSSLQVDPILAQGAGVAIEDAYHLVYHLVQAQGEEGKEGEKEGGKEGGDRIAKALR